MINIYWILFSMMLLTQCCKHKNKNKSLNNEIIQAEKFRPFMFVDTITGDLDILTPTKTAIENQISQEQYQIFMERIKQQILPKPFPKTQVFVYSGLTKNGMVASYPGPTLIAKKNVPVKVKWINRIAGAHIFPIDINYPFDSTSAFKYQVPCVPHAHGVVTGVQSDGQPAAYFTSLGKKGSKYDTIEPCQKNQAIFKYPNQQDSGIFWYHDHTHGITRLNVYAGLVGLYEIIDPDTNKAEDAIKSYYGDLQTKYFIIGDKTFKTDGELYYYEQSQSQFFTSWNPEFYGNTIIVNGKLWPKLMLKQKKYRFIFLNGCQSRYLNIFFKDGNKMLSFDLIRTQGDYFINPVKVSQYMLTVSARIQLIIDFTNSIGQIIVKNNAQAPQPTGNDQDLVDQFTGTIMKIFITPNQISNTYLKKLIHKKEIQKSIQKKTQIINIALKNAIYPAFNEGKKIFITLNQIQQNLHTTSMFINGISFHNSQKWKNVIYKIGEVYDFYIINLTPDTHPMHMHLINFQKIGQIPFNAEEYTSNFYENNGGQPDLHGFKQYPIIMDPSPYYTGPMEQVKDYEKTFRDVIDAIPQYVTIIRIKFSHNNGSNFGFNVSGKSYVWHCHILQHQDNDMMAYFHLI